jgi:hypothetical protein
MATKNGLGDYLKSTETRRFEKRPYYEPETDSLICYFRDTPSYGKRVNNHLTVFLAQADNSLVGVEVAGLTLILRAVEGLGDIRIGDPLTVNDENGDGSFPLSVLVRCALVPEAVIHVTGECYEELTQATDGVQVNREEMCLV